MNEPYEYDEEEDLPDLPDPEPGYHWWVVLVFLSMAAGMYLGYLAVYESPLTQAIQQVARDQGRLEAYEELLALAQKRSNIYLEPVTIQGVPGQCVSDFTVVQINGGFGVEFDRELAQAVVQYGEFYGNSTENGQSAILVKTSQ